MSDVLDRLGTGLAGRYAIVRELGRGGMATVYLARDLKHDRRVALKVLHPQLALAVGPARFLREVKITAQFHHPHILALYDSGSVAGEEGGEDAAELLYYIMPYVEGESLRDRLNREKQLPLDDALRIAREVADALSYAHRHGVIHRDIKPENILLESGHASVADFGIAGAIMVAGGMRLTETGLALGTPAYMSPEQAAGERELDERTDLYSLGCVLYEMLAGEPPITGPSVAAVLARKSVESPPQLRRVRSAVPAAVERVVTRSLAPVPADRQRTAAELIEELSRATEASPPAQRTPDTVSKRRRRLIGVGVIGALVLLAAGAMWQLVPRGSHSAAAANRVVVLPYENQTGDATLDPIGRMAAEWITEGLAHTSEVQVVPSLIAFQILAGIASADRRPGPEAPIQELARLTESSLAVTGSYYRHGDELEFHSAVLDLGSSLPLGVVEPVMGRADDPAAAIDSVRRRVMGVLASRLGWVRWEIPASVRPPSYEAYRVYAEAIRHWSAGEYSEAAPQFERAFALDSTYLRALILASSAYGYAGDETRADSLTEFLLVRRDRLSPYDQNRLDLGLAALRGDREAQLVAARAAVALVPVGTARFALITALKAVNRPREALSEMEGAMRGGATEGPMTWYALWGLWTELYHLVGRHEKELEVAREARAGLAGSLPTMEYEGRALAALGHLDEARALTEEVLTARAHPQITAGDVLLAIARELRAHGHPVLAGELADRAIAWYDAQAAVAIARGRRRDLKASLLYFRGRWSEAAAAWDSVPPDSANAVGRVGVRGVLAARMGLADSARTVATELAQLDRPRLNGQHTLWRARIAAVLGDQEAAVTLLRQAFAQGVGYGTWLHTDVDLEALWDYRPFRELVRPRG